LGAAVEHRLFTDDAAPCGAPGGKDSRSNCRIDGCFRGVGTLARSRHNSPCPSRYRFTHTLFYSSRPFSCHREKVRSKPREGSCSFCCSFSFGCAFSASFPNRSHCALPSIVRLFEIRGISGKSQCAVWVFLF